MAQEITAYPNYRNLHMAVVVRIDQGKPQRYNYHRTFFGVDEMKWMLLRLTSLASMGLLHKELPDHWIRSGRRERA